MTLNLSTISGIALLEELEGLWRRIAFPNQVAVPIDLHG